MRNLFYALGLSLACSWSLEQSASVKVEKILETSTSWNGDTLKYAPGEAKLTALIVEIAPHAQTGWHLHPMISYAYVLQGELQVELKDGSIKKAKAGDSFAEVVQTWHNGTNLGEIPVKLLVLYAGNTEQALSHKEP